MKPVVRARPDPDTIRFMKYITFDENDKMNGVREDAPEWAKKQYEEYVKNYNRALKKGTRI